MTIRIDTDEVRTAAGTLEGAATPLDNIATSLTGLSGVTHPDVLDGLDSFGVAWSSAIDVLADDVRYVAGRAVEISDRYDETDGRLADIATDPNAIQPA